VNRFKNLIKWFVIILIVVLSIMNILLTVYMNREHEEYVDRHVQDAINIILNTKEPINPINGIDGYTPIKGVDYFDGSNGKDGESIKGDTGATGEQGATGKDAYFNIQCNTEKNRWEIKFSQDDKWQALNGEPIRCTL